jgi:hypothetical protein
MVMIKGCTCKFSEKRDTSNFTPPPFRLRKQRLPPIAYLLLPVDQQPPLPLLFAYIYLAKPEHRS